MWMTWPQFALAQENRASVNVAVRSAGEPVVGATITVAGISVVTGREGAALVEIPPGAVDVVVSKDGYLPAVTTLTVGAAERRDLEIELRRLEEAIVVSARSGTRLEDQPLRVEVIDREEIEEKAMMTPGNVAMLVSETTGLRVQTTAPSLGSANVRIQGLRGRYSQLLADGLPLYGTRGDSLSLLQVPPLDLGRVEVIKGVASALYGTSALGGVLNLVSRRPRADERQLLVNATSQTGRDVAGWYSRASSVTPWAWTLLGSYSGQTQRDLDGDGWSDIPTFNRAVIRPRMFFDNGRGRTVFATLGVTTEGREGGTLPPHTAPDGLPFRESLSTRHVDGGLAGSWLVTGGRVVSVRASALTQAQARQEGNATEHGTQTVWFGEASLHGVNGAHTWVLGGAFQQDRFAHDELPQFNFRFSTPAVFGQDEIAFGRKWTLGVSARADAHSEYGTLAAPRVSLLARPSPGWTVRVAGGTGAFAPTPFTEETEATGLSRVLPLRGLKAERAASTSVDVTRVLGALEVTGTVFASVVHDPLQQHVVDAGHVELVNASSPTRTTGTELLVRYRAGQFTALFTHGWTRSTEIDPDRGDRREVPLTPRHSASLTVMWEADGAGRLGFETYYTGRQPLDDNPYRATGRPYVLIGALAEKRIGRLRVFINAENLLDVRQTRADPLVLPARRPDGRWTVDAWAPLDGRVVNGGIRVIF
jgi:outer membrane receptor for ferrienterochelin and colicins